METAVRLLTTRAAPERHSHQLVRYVIVGGCGYVIAMAIYALGLALGASAYAAIIPAFVLNGAFNFVGNRWWSFPASGRPVQSELVRFCVVAMGTLVANYCVMYLLHDLAGLPAIPAQAITIVAVVPVGFLGNKLWSFDAA